MNHSAKTGNGLDPLVLPTSISRRQFLRRTSALAAGALVLPAGPSAGSLLSSTQTLKLLNVHTGEELELRGRPDRDYDRATRLQFSNLLRDHHADEMREMDPALIDIFFALAAVTGSEGPFEILSGYRSPETNNWLRSHHRGVAEHSMHIEGKAVDIRMERVSTRQIRAAGLALAMGGVGYYPRSNFVHLDTGSIRTW